MTENIMLIRYVGREPPLKKFANSIAKKILSIFEVFTKKYFFLLKICVYYLNVRHYTKKKLISIKKLRHSTDPKKIANLIIYIF